MKFSLSGGGAVRAVAKGTLWAVIVTLGMVLLFAFIIKSAGLSGDIIKPVVQGIKVLSIFFGVFVTLRQIEKNGWFYGAIVGLVYTALAFFVFSILDSSFSVTSGLLVDMIFAMVIGVICAGILNMFRHSA